MKKIIIILFTAIFLISCSTAQKVETGKAKPTSKAKNAVMWTTVGVAVIALALASEKGSSKASSNSSNIMDTASNGVITLGLSGDHAGAISSLKWNGKEFIDDYDHGRLLQSASSFNGLGEAFNPTEAGGGAVDRRSILIASSKSADGLTLSTTTQMAYWNPVNGEKLSNHILHKRVTLGHRGLSNVIEYNVQFDIPNDRQYNYGVFEALTAYMPKDFNTFWIYQSGSLTRHHVTPNTFREQDKPIIASTADGKYAIGVWSPRLPQGGIGYGAFVLNNNVPKWNAVFRENNPSGSKHYQMFVFVGSKEDVKRSMNALNVR